MKKLAAIASIILFVSSSCFHQSETVLKVATFNTGHFNQGKLGGYQNDDVNEELSKWKSWASDEQFDIFFVQEWNWFFDKDSTIEAIESILRPSFNNIVFGDNNPWIHNGICTNLPIDNKRIEKLSTDYYAVATDTKIDNKIVTLISVHVNWNTNYHLSDIDHLVEYLKNFEYFICGGDMNASNATQLRFKDAGFNIANGGERGFLCTYPENAEKKGNYCLDNIITSGNITIENPYTIATSINDQDHLPVIATIKF